MFEQLFVLLELPLELTFQALLELLVFGERSHQLVAEMSYTLIQGGGPPCVLILRPYIAGWPL